MYNKEKISKLKQIINTNLLSLINDDYCLLDIPDHKNIGDNLIWAGELEFLKSVPFKMTYSSNLHFFQQEKILNTNIILLHGGGNFGDVWRIVQDFRLKVISKFKHKKIIIFPQTVQYEDEVYLKKDVDIFSAHPDLTICARDTRSFDFLSKHFVKNKILLVPDMAFCLNYDEFVRKERTNKVLILQRVDKELRKDFDAKKIAANIKGDKIIEVKDWPTFNMSDLSAKIEILLLGVHNKLSRGLLKVPYLKNMVDPRYGLKSKIAREKYIERGIQFINEYEDIYTSRLHGFILAVLLQKKVSIVDNNYGKNSGFYLTWLTDFDNCELLGETK